MSFTEFLIVFSALLVLAASIRYTWLTWRNAETEEARMIRKLMVQYAAERERLMVDRDHWMRETADYAVQLQEARKKIEHLRRQIPQAKLVEIDDSWNGE